MFVQKMASKTHATSKTEVFRVTTPMGLLEFLLVALAGKSRTAIKSHLTHRQVSVNGLPVTKYDHALRTGDEISIFYGKVAPGLRHPGIKILFEDDSLIVVDKAAGLLSIATDNERENTVFNILSQYVKNQADRSYLFVLHRLDKDTSGVMMFAKSKTIQEEIQRHWKRTVTDRSYIAVVEGSVNQDNGTVVSYLRESKAMKMHSTPNEAEGQKAETHYRVISRSHGYSLVEVKLDTGRKNQIRAHMTEMGHPIAGDKKYGARTNPAGRLCLHAHILTFVHPKTRQTLKFESPIPRSFSRIMG